jgi:hypothetical protein
MQPDASARPEYVEAFRQMALRIENSLANTSKRALPIKMYVAGGAAVHFYTGARISEDVDAAFSHRILLPEHLDVAYRDADGAARLLYFDRQYNDTLGLMHEDAHDDSVSLSLSGIDAKVLDVRLLAPVDLAISKLGRFAEHDRLDIVTLAQRGLFKVATFRKRADEAAVAYVGDVTRLHNSIDIACRLIDDACRTNNTRSRLKIRTSKK